MDLRALRYFVHVAEARSFSKAAVQLRIAQPALSRQIRKLEDEVGIALILRTRRQLELTDAGLLLLQRAHSLLRQAAQTADDVRAHGSRVQGTLTLGVSPTICEALVPRIARECATLHPELHLNFVEGFSGGSKANGEKAKTARAIESVAASNVGVAVVQAMAQMKPARRKSMVTLARVLRDME